MRPIRDQHLFVFALHKPRRPKHYRKVYVRAWNDLDARAALETWMGSDLLRYSPIRLIGTSDVNQYAINDNLFAYLFEVLPEPGKMLRN